MRANPLDCSACVGHETSACDDCVVRFVVDRAVLDIAETDIAETDVVERGLDDHGAFDGHGAHGAGGLDDAEARAIRILAEAGLLAEVRPLRAAS